MTPAFLKQFWMVMEVSCFHAFYNTWMGFTSLPAVSFDPILDKLCFKIIDRHHFKLLITPWSNGWQNAVVFVGRKYISIFFIFRLHGKPVFFFFENPFDCQIVARTQKLSWKHQSFNLITIRAGCVFE